jgi:SAM-dependent methyltransferase
VLIQSEQLNLDQKIHSSQCLGCAANAVQVLIRSGDLAPSNRFSTDLVSREDCHPLRVGQCMQCGLLQLVSPMPSAVVRPRHAWITYSEPEQHLDALVMRLLQKTDRNARIFGITTNDDSTLNRLNLAGRKNTYRFDIRSDLEVDAPYAGLESIQSAFAPELTDALVARHGTADLLIVRYLLEHAHSPRAFLAEMSRLLAPDGRMVVEVPACNKFVDACDYSLLWEEHITYFSRRTFSETLRRAGFEVLEMIVSEYSLEDSLIAIVAKNRIDPVDEEDGLVGELRAGQVFSETFEATKTGYRKYLGDLHGRGKRIALFGAGHFAAMFLNLFDLGDQVNCVIDDNASKQGLLMPGTLIPILGSERLSECDICLLALNPETEKRIVSKFGAFERDGGEFISIFSRSPLALELS